jgi:hypothetical protein
MWLKLNQYETYFLTRGQPCNWGLSMGRGSVYNKIKIKHSSLLKEVFSSTSTHPCRQCYYIHTDSHSIAQVVIHQFFTTVVCIQSHTNSCKICGQNATGAGFLQLLQLCLLILMLAFHFCNLSSEAGTIGQLQPQHKRAHSHSTLVGATCRNMHMWMDKPLDYPLGVISLGSK